VVVVLVVVDVVVLVVELVVEDAAARRGATLVVARVALLEPSSRPWKTIADADTTVIAATMHAPITHERVLIRPTLGESAPRRPRLSGASERYPFFGISRKGLPLLASGSLGRPSTRSPRMLRWISSVPP